MKKDIHPKYYPDAKIICACGNTFTTGSTLPEIKVELCSACHPFYTGKQKLVDTARLVEKFQARVEAKKEMKRTHTGKKVKRAARDQVRAKKEVAVKAEKPKDSKKDVKKGKNKKGANKK